MNYHGSYFSGPLTLAEITRERDEQGHLLDTFTVKMEGDAPWGAMTVTETKIDEESLRSFLDADMGMCILDLVSPEDA